MRPAGCWLLVAHAAFFEACHASQAPGSLRLDIARSQNPQPLLRRRGTTTDGAVLGTIQNLQNQYTINVTVGTPPQALTLTLDTGSSDLWLPGVDSAACQAGNCTYGDYDMSMSSTAEMYLEDQFLIAYVDGSEASGSYITETVRVGGANVANLTVGYASKLTGLNSGLMGVGYPGIEGTTEGHFYNNIPIQLVLDGVINTAAYSLWLDDYDAATGSILFGAIDTSKYHGDLTLLDFWLETGFDYITRFLVMLSGITAVSDSGSDALGSSSFPFTALLDSGTTYTYLPNDLALEILEEVAGTYDEDSDFASVPCELADSTGYYSFSFGGSAAEGGAVVNVSMSDLVFLDSRDGSGTRCEFGLHPMGQVTSSVILGDSFLRSAYVVYDLVNNQAAIAQTNFDAKPEDSEVVTFASVGAPVPHATLAPGNGNNTGAKAAVTTTLASLSAAAGFTDVPTGASAAASSTSSAGPSPTTTKTSSGSKESVGIAGPAIGGAAAGVLVLGSGAYVWRAMAAKKRKRYAQVEAPAGAGAGAGRDEAKVPLVPTEGEYNRLNQVQTAYKDDHMA